ncbi:probable aspartic proteinase GIP2 [Lycium ferocissimum]|uniref:probable aspartic proteinase GIP2 n=1 Tax=Lycium ferocissimum TaxID=112874 RepID=UPI00281583B5|nr:probable aspartic proteinase GIP2 [Lycium ferocissimum]
MKIPQLLCTFLFFLLFISSISIAKKSLRHYPLLLPVFKDEITGQYLTQIYQRTPLVPVKVTVDLGGRFLWVDCENDYISSSYKNVPCGSTPCKLSGSQGCYGSSRPIPPRPGCNNHTCSHIPYNPINSTSTDGELAQDIMALWSTNYNDSKIGHLLSSASGVMFSCCEDFLLQELAYGVKGMAGLGNGYTGLPSQLARAFRLPRKFAICLSANTKSNGVILFGEGRSVYASNDALTYTPLLKNHVSTAGAYYPGEPSVEYFIGVKKILVNGKIVPINSKLLAINKTNGVGGTKISTVVPYGTMETSIYKAFKQEFLKAIDKVPIAEPIRPFELCFNLLNLGTLTGLIIPQVSLVLQDDQNNTTWDLSVDNFMASPVDSSDLLCLGFLDGGKFPRTSIVLGGLQIEENLLEFDLVKKRVGFKSLYQSSLLKCSNKFSFTSKA